MNCPDHWLGFPSTRETRIADLSASASAPWLHGPVLALRVAVHEECFGAYGQPQSLQ